MESWEHLWTLYDMATSEEQWQFAQDVGLLLHFAEKNGYKLTFGDAFRSKQEQQRVFDAGLSKTLSSRHAVRCAVDFNIWKDTASTWGLPADERHEVVKPLGDFWESLDEKNSWGVKRGAQDWDEGHFERMG